MSKQNVYDDRTFFENYRKNRNQAVNFNDCIESPILFSMLPDLQGKSVLDIGCGMGQHAKQYSEMGAASVLGTDISEKMLSYAREHNSAKNITYLHLAMEQLEVLDRKFDLITSSLVFDYVEDFDGLMVKIRNLMNDDAKLVFSLSHPIVTAWDGVYDRYTRTETGERLYANLRNYCMEGLRKVDWVVNGYEYYHRTVSSLINGLISAGLVIEECQEAYCSEELRTQYPALFGGTMHRPEFIFFRCRKACSDRFGKHSSVKEKSDARSD
ncbi:MAG: methyltransferase domain-containing protein [Clostridia bacterium]|nr:methyltransferase domain-containing protein [Clostridia bacterium]